MRLWRRAGPTALLVVAFASCGAALVLSSLSARFVFITGQVLLYLPIFASGMLIARWTAERTTPGWLVHNSRWGLLAGGVFVAVVAPSASGSGLLPVALSWGIFAFFALLCALHDPLLSALARKRAVMSVGAFSYSLYLIHEPFVHLAYGLFGQLRLSPAAQFLVYECGVLPACVALGYLFYRCVERPLTARARFVFKPAPRPPLAEPAQLAPNAGDR
jgi:peptidoglycan/LPS O-acetylase OafA/YrhL